MLPEGELLDLTTTTVRAINQRLHDGLPAPANGRCRIIGAAGQHALACGLNAAYTVDIEGHVGYYCAGMNQHATVFIHGNAGVGVAENMMSGEVRVRGNASQSAGASGHGGLLVIEGDAAARCGISMKGVDIVVRGSVGHMSAFMAQAGTLVVCGDAGPALGDSIYEAELFVRGSVPDLGVDCEEKPMDDIAAGHLGRLLRRAGVAAEPRNFRRYGSARQLYNFHIDHAGKY